MLCFDPTRGIDIRTKQQIYVLLRDLAEAGAAALKVVQARLGHASIQMTADTYGHLFPSQDEDQAAMQQLQARLVG